MVAETDMKAKNEITEEINDDLEIKKEENDDDDMKEEVAKIESDQDEPAAKKVKEEKIETESQDEEVKEEPNDKVISKKEKRGRGAPKKKPIKKEASSEKDDEGKDAVVEDKDDDDDDAETLEPGKIRSLKTLDKFITNEDNSRNIIYMQDIPEICKDKPCMLGVDEAGRGPVLGPMVYGIAFCPTESKDLLVDLGCADSKQLTEEKRDQIFQKFNKQEKARTTMGWAVELISPNTISTSMYRRSKYSLNEISMGSAIGLITMALDAGVNVAEVYVDTVGPPEKYQDKLKGIFPQIPKIVVAKKADSTYPIVSAASICAKVTRDHALQVWQFPEGLDVKASDFGSGYPGDPVTKRFLSDNIDSLFGFPRLVRFSWSTAENALMDKAFDMEFDEPEQEKPKYAGPKLTKFFKGTTKDGELKREPCRFLKERFLNNVVDF